MKTTDSNVGQDLYRVIGFDEARYLAVWRNGRRSEEEIASFSPKRYYDLPHAQRATLQNWIAEHVREGRKGATLISGGALRFLMHRDTGLYVPQPCMLGALLYEGWVPKTFYCREWHYQRMRVIVDCPQKSFGADTCKASEYCRLCAWVRPHRGRVLAA